MIRRSFALLLILAFLLSCAPYALAEDTEELHRELNVLRAQEQQLREELESVRARISELEKAIAAAEATPKATAKAKATATPKAKATAKSKSKATATPAARPAQTPGPQLSVGTAYADETASLARIRLTETIYTDGKKVSDYSRTDPIRMGLEADYPYYDGGVFCFRSSNLRQNAAFGTAALQQKKLSVVWSYPLGSLRTQDNGTLYGVGWTGQPAIIKWAKEAREQLMNINASKRGVTALKEVIFGALDGNIYFLDLNDGQPTRDPIRVGYPLKSSVTVNTNGIPMIGVGQAISKLHGQSGTKPIGYYVYSLLDGSELLFLNGRKTKTQEQYSTNGAFDGSALYDRATDTLIVAGENGLIYTVAMNTDFRYMQSPPTLTVAPQITALRTKAKAEKDGETSVESSIAMVGRYLYTADAYGILQCIDTDSMTAVWVRDVGDNTDAAPALDVRGEKDILLFTGSTAYARNKSKIPVALRCLDALTGRELWQVQVSCQYDASQLAGLKASPLVGQHALDDLVYFTVNMAGGSNVSRLLALQKKTGAIAWELPITAPAVSSPVAVYDADGNGYVIQADQNGSLYLLDGLTGRLYDTVNLGGSIQASPAVYNSMLVIGTCSKDNACMYGIRIQ